MPEIEAQYQKRVGLPGYSSHSFSVSIKADLANVADVDREASKLYVLLQQAVDTQIVESGYVPEPILNGNGDTNGNGSGHPRNGNHQNGQSSGYRSNGHSNGNGSTRKWACSDKQRDLIERMTEENRLRQDDLEDIARGMFDRNIAGLNRMEMSGFISELLERYPKKGSIGNGHGQRSYSRGGRR